MGLDALRTEHRRALDLLEGRGDLGSLERLLAGHFASEEEGLLVLLDAWLPRTTGPVAVILEEHREIRLLFAVPPGAVEVVRLRGILREHFRKEEEVLFPFAQERLPPERLAGLGGG